ncbi:MAG: acetyl-CoA C-acyltransferase [Deltaproteobacteria bacterium]|nr:acetyl-CoA C-acyltransferase [Deltaproteobacteria bacterium]MBW2110941.1 acetyl-CoA C-acyltransferase [Deltaproteobacteria bacterium]MBW2352651.1 acetyl-CoA C-acyltransferase [Deltaproteobacteria bacterium]HDZ90592.1 acetyl-CoA C-acyltransferase [Deltaproteobacteria bacterium]
MKEAVIVAACRTAVGKAPRGILKDTRPEQMGCAVLGDLLKRAGDLDPMLIDDVIVGCTFPESVQGLNLGRVLVMSMGWPDRIPGMTVNRFCSSGLQAIAIGAEKIMCGYADVVISGGVESMSQIPMGGSMMYPNPALVEMRPGSFTGMGLTAENVAERFNIGRDEQDEFGAKSQQKAEAALKAGRFKSQIVPLTVRRQKTLPNGHFEYEEFIFDTDEGIRPGTTKEGISKIPPAFKPNGSVTAGNSSQTSDAAAGVVLMSKEKARELGLKPMATFRYHAVEGCEPEVMGVGPAVAIPRVLKIAGMTLDQMELIELNEAFAAQAIYCIKELGINEEITNVNGGAIALGHPLGCTGAKLTTQLIYEMQERNLRWGLVSMCIGFGMGAAAIFEIEDY